MPMTRYEIRNEYSLADLQLYTTADKDDPEALLEGVAMAGLVGLLRQLGDLAEFASEIFHELHEEVMVAASRGHNIKSRVQQLEAEVSSIEKSFLCQTDHSSSLYNTGLDWHPNLRMYHNLVTQGDLPRFIMDSYEECRGPPCLFLLDKFDVAGDGACLKRYTDPAIFKIETHSMLVNGTDVQREKKIRKAKKKGPRLRNGGTPEALPQSHAKLHQLFMEEHVRNVDVNPSRRVKLKRRLNGFPFDLRTGQSYMGKFLETPSPEHKVLHEVTVNMSSSMILSANDHTDRYLGIVQGRPTSPDRDSVEINITPASPQEDITLTSSTRHPEMVSRGKILKSENPYPSISDDDVPNTCDMMHAEKDMTVDEERITEVGLISYLSDDSEIDSYVDAPIGMESEIDTNSELRVKNDITSRIKSQTTITNVHSTEGQLHFKFSPSQSAGNPVESHGGNYSPKKEVSISCSFNRPSFTESEIYVPAEDMLPGDIPEIEDNCSSSYCKIANEDGLVAQYPKSAVFGDSLTGPTAIKSQMDASEQLASGRCCTGLVSTLADGDSGAVLREIDSGVVLRDVVLRDPESYVKSCILDQEVKKTNLAVEPACSPGFSDSDSQFGDSAVAMSPDFLQEDSDQVDMRGHDQDEKLFPLNEEQKENLAIDPACSFNVSDSELMLGDNSPSSSAGAFDISADFVHEGDTSKKNLNLGENFSVLNNSNIHLPDKDDTLQMISNETLVNGKLNDGDLKLPENYMIDHPFMSQEGDNFMPGSPKEDKNRIYELHNVARNEFPGASNDFSCIMEAFSGNELEKASLGNTQTIYIEKKESAKSSINHIGSPDLTLSYLKCSEDRPMTSLDASGGDGAVICDDQTIVNETLVVEAHEVVGLQVTGIKEDVSSHDSACSDSSCCTLEKFEFPIETRDIAEKDEFPPCMSSNGPGANESSVSPVLIPLDKAIVLINGPDSRKNPPDIAIVASSVPARADSVVQDDVCLPLDLDKLMEQAKYFFETSYTNELENGKNVLSVSRRESDSSEEVVRRGFPQLVNGGVFCDTSNHNLLRSDLDVAVGQSFDSIHTAATIQSSTNEVVPSFQEYTTLQPVLLHVEVVNSDEIDKDLSPSLTISDQQILDVDDNQLASGSTSKCSLMDCPSPPLASELPSQCNSLPLFSMFPQSNPFLDANSINLEDLPPLPPLPPVQWRIGKFHHATSIAERETIQQEELSLQGVFASFKSTAHVNSMHEELDQSHIQISQNNASNKEEVEHKSTMETINLPPKTGKVQQDVAVSSSEIGLTSSAEEDGIITDSGIASKREWVEHSLNSSGVSHKLEMENEKRELIIATKVISGREGVEHNLNSSGVSHKHKMENEKQELIIAINMTSGREGVEHNLNSLDVSHKHEKENAKHELIIASEMPSIKGEVEHSLNCSDVSHKHKMENEKQELIIANNMTSGREGTEHSLNSLNVSHKHKKENEKHELIIAENEKQVLINSSSETEFLSQVVEDGNANSNQTKKLPLPRNPLVDGLDALDKSKLRKVTDRVRPEIQKVNERDSFLEQIRTKSFNLKPALATRPSIRGPRTNLKVAAILEKANAIRQALTGSDDEDSWSDS